MFLSPDMPPAPPNLQKPKRQVPQKLIEMNSVLFAVHKSACGKLRPCDFQPIPGEGRAGRKESDSFCFADFQDKSVLRGQKLS